MQTAVSLFLRLNVTCNPLQPMGLVCRYSYVCTLCRPESRKALSWKKLVSFFLQLIGPSLYSSSRFNTSRTNTRSSVSLRRRRDGKLDHICLSVCPKTHHYLRRKDWEGTFLWDHNWRDPQNEAFRLIWATEQTDQVITPCDCECCSEGEQLDSSPAGLGCILCRQLELRPDIPCLRRQDEHALHT